MIQIPLAYKFVAIMAMIGQINYYAPRLHLPLDVPIKEQDIRFLRVSPPYKDGFGSARLQVKNYSFTFKSNSLSIVNLSEDGLESFGIPILKLRESSISVLDRASKMKYTVSTNDTYRIATNWLEVLDIDLAKLEKANPRHVNKYPLFNSDRGWVPNPVLIVDWHSTNSPGRDPTEVLVTISAVSGELLQLTDGGFFSKREHPWLMDVDKLIAISDEEFLKYSSLERSNLVVRFTGLHCSTMSCPGFDKPPDPETNEVSPNGAK